MDLPVNTWYYHLATKWQWKAPEDRRQCSHLQVRCWFQVPRLSRTYLTAFVSERPQKCAPPSSSNRCPWNLPVSSSALSTDGERLVIHICVRLAGPAQSKCVFCLLLLLPPSRARSKSQNPRQRLGWTVPTILAIHAGICCETFVAPRLTIRSRPSLVNTPLVSCSRISS